MSNWQTAASESNGAHREPPIEWAIPEASACKAWPLRPDGEPDYLSLDPANLIRAGSVIGSIEPKFATMVQAGHGVRTRQDGALVATASGFVERSANGICIHAFEVIVGDLCSADHESPAGLLIHGSVKAGRVSARGPLAVRGLVAGATVQAAGPIMLERAGRSRILTESSLYVTQTLRHCDVIACDRIVAIGNAAMSGGSLTAGEGIVAYDLGADDGVSTSICVGADRVNAYRLEEMEEEIEAIRENVHRITQALRPLTANLKGLPPERQRLAKTLTWQREQLEARIAELYAERRAALVGNGRAPGAVLARGTVRAGVRISIQKATMTVSSTLGATVFSAGREARDLTCEPLAA